MKYVVTVTLAKSCEKDNKIQQNSWCTNPVMIYKCETFTRLLIKWQSLLLIHRGLQIPKATKLQTDVQFTEG